MIHRFRFAVYFLLTACFLTGFSHAVSAQEDSKVPEKSQEISQNERLSLASEFLKRMKKGFRSAEKVLKLNAAQADKSNLLPDGEELLFQVYLPRRLKLDNVMFGRVENRQIVLSFRDFLTILEMPITIDSEAKTAQGWYIRENKSFSLDGAAQKVQSDAGTFNLTPSVRFEGEDIYVPISALGQWFDFEIEAKVAALELYITPSQPLPIQERLDREKREAGRRRSKEPELPQMNENRQLIDVPFIDVSTNSRYDNPGDSDTSTTRHTANIRTAGDFAYGTLSTQTQMNDEDQITNIRVNYKQESLDADLLGPLKAKRFEVGDVIKTRLPLGGGINQELGARITNVDPLRTFTNPTTAISGTTFPGWDVELYRKKQFLGFQRVGDDGFYSFDNVLLFNDENVFRIVFYGPQGEVREEELSVPVDLSRLAESGGVYDVSLTFEDEQTYRKSNFDDEDKGSPNLVAFYEKPILPGTAASVGFRSGEQDGERNNVLHAGVSTTIGQTLVNFNAALDDEAEAAAELVARRNIRDHELVNTARWFADSHDTDGAGDDSQGFFRNQFRANGPLPFKLGNRPRYLVGFNFNQDSDGDASTTSNLGFNTSWRNFTFNEQLNYSTSSNAPDQVNNFASVTGTFGPNRVRLVSDYELKPDTQLNRVVASLNHDFSRDLDLDLQLERRIDPSLTEASAQLNWQAGWARISPSVSYNSDNDFFAGLNTNFGLARDPQSPGIKMFDRSITSNGGISVLVFLDENGDGVFNENEKPLEEVAVRALQNGGRELTDENGRVFFDRVRELKLTDVLVEEDTLQDPFWISGFEGASILPREGYVAELQFPIHNAGELDGTLYARTGGGKTSPLRNIPMHLYNADGEIEQTAKTDIGGFYLFSRIPPGRYLLLVDYKSAETFKFARPKPQQIEVGYDGTIIYGNDVFVNAGQKDIPSSIIADLDDYKARHPHIDFTGADYNIALNLGEYNSRLLMSTVWYRLHTRYRPILVGGQLLVLPEHSYPDVKTGKHTLRVGFHNANLDDAYNRCHALIARDITCRVEILPGSEQKFAMQ